MDDTELIYAWDQINQLFQDIHELEPDEQFIILKIVINKTKKAIEEVSNA